MAEQEISCRIKEANRSERKTKLIWTEQSLLSATRDELQTSALSSDSFRRQRDQSFRKISIDFDVVNSFSWEKVDDSKSQTCYRQHRVQLLKRLSWCQIQAIRRDFVEVTHSFCSIPFDFKWKKSRGISSSPDFAVRIQQSECLRETTEQIEVKETEKRDHKVI